MTTVQTSVTDNQSTVPFYYLRITGLPYYIFATIDPSAAAYGSSKWNAPTGYPTTWAQRGLQLPDDQISQRLPDIIGGVGSAAKTKVSVIDFADPDHIGKGFFSRLFAPGRTISDTSIVKSILAVQVEPDIGLDSTVNIGGTTGTWSSGVDAYIGAETIRVGTYDAGVPTELAAIVRNKYVCYGNSADGGNYWPPQPYHNITHDSDGNVITAPMVTGEAVDILGRTAALWMGHMKPGGVPESESSSTCLLLGRIVDIGIGKIGGVFDLTIEPITADLTKGKVAPDLGHGTIKDSFYLGGANTAWLSFYVSTIGKVTISQNTYATPQSLANAVNTALASAGATFLTLELDQNGGDTVFAFRLLDAGVTTFSVASSPLTSTGTGNESPGAESLLHALGFDPTQATFTTAGGSTTAILPASRPVASVFVPCTNTSQSLSLTEPNAAGNFFTDQGDGTGEAWGRFSNGCMVKVTAVTGGSTNAVTTGQAFSDVPGITKADGEPGFGHFYYVEKGVPAFIDQVVVSRTAAASGGHTKFLGRLLASTKGHSSASNGILNVFPKFVGMGWNTLLTASQWLKSDESGIARVAIVDRNTKWIDLFRPYAREHGLFIVWDPSSNGIALRRITIPNAAAAGTNVTFSESNRANVNDRTSQRVDRSNIRTSWKLQPAFEFGSIGGGIFSAFKTKLLPTQVVVTLTDARSRSMYPNDDREEPISDDTMVASASMIDIIRRRIDFYSTPWTVCSRSMSKKGMLLAPGTIHKVIDSTLVNPFTGATGIVTGDDVYCFLTSVSMRPADGSVTIEFVIDSTDDNSLYRQWSPTALVDFNLNSFGYTHGYNSATKVLSTVARYGTTYDGDYFAAGDTIRVITRDNSDTTSSQTDTIAAMLGSGAIQVTTGLSALSTTSETIVILQKYNSATTTRKTGATKVSWQGSGDARVIQGSSTARLNRWS